MISPCYKNEHKIVFGCTSGTSSLLFPVSPRLWGDTASLSSTLCTPKVSVCIYVGLCLRGGEKRRCAVVYGYQVTLRQPRAMPGSKLIKFPPEVRKNPWIWIYVYIHVCVCACMYVRSMRVEMCTYLYTVHVRCVMYSFCRK